MNVQSAALFGTVFLSLLWAGCTQTADPTAVEADLKSHVIEAEQTHMVPSAIYKKLKGKAAELELLSVPIYVSETAKHPLGGRPQKLVTPPGGGLLDLSRIFDRTRGAPIGGYAVFLDLPELKDEKSDIEVWFICNAKPRHLQFHEDIGCQCGAAYNVTSLFKKLHKSGKGLNLALAEDRDLAAIGGTLLISAAREGGRRGLARLTLTDRKRPHAFCGNPS